MRFYFRTPGESKFNGPSEADEIQRQLTAGTLPPDTEALEATGQTFGQLKRATGWIPVATLLRDLPPASRPITAATHCFVLSGSERRGPFVIKQVETMWQSGAITADARLEWDGADPVPLAVALRHASHHASETAPAPIWKIVLTPLGAIVGLLASFLFRPQFLGRGPGLDEWLTKGLQSPYASTIIVCAVIGAVVGFVAGLLIDANSAKT